MLLNVSSPLLIERVNVPWLLFTLDTSHRRLSKDPEVNELSDNWSMLSGSVSSALLNLAPSPMVLRVNDTLSAVLTPEMVELPPPKVAIVVNDPPAILTKSPNDPVSILVRFNPFPTDEPENPTVVPFNDAVNVAFNPAESLISFTKF